MPIHRPRTKTAIGAFVFFSFSLSAQAPRVDSQAPTVGIVFAGGGSFGAFEVGALQAFLEQWQAEHGSPAPVRVIAGTSAGALIAPFTALGKDGIAEITDLYRTAKRSTVFSLRTSILLPFALFGKLSTSVYDADPLARLIRDRLPDERLRKLTAMWPGTRVVVLGTDFGTGQPAAYSNNPQELLQNEARFRAGLLASASSPLTVAPVYIANQPHFDGGVSAIAPFQAFFDLAAQPPEVALTHIVIISPYAPYPSTDSGQAQRRPFPANPNFEQISARTGTLLSEALFSKELAVVWTAISLRAAGISKEKVQEQTGLSIGNPSVDLILMAPSTRLGWDSLRFDRAEQEEMFTRGLRATPRHLIP